MNNDGVFLLDNDAFLDFIDRIKGLEFSIDYIGRRIVFLKELIRTKRTLMEIKE